MSKESALDINFAGGIDQSQRIELLDPRASFPELENGRQRTVGAYSKRYGFAPQTLNRLGGGARSAGRKLVARGRSACVIDGQTLDTFSPALGINASAGRVNEVSVTRLPVAAMSSLSNSDQVGLVAVNGLYFASTIEADFTGLLSVNVHVFDPVSRTTLKSFPVLGYTNAVDTRVAAPLWVKLVSVGSAVILIYNTSATAIVARRLDATNATTIAAGWSAATSLITTWAGIDFDAIGSETKFAIAYTSSAGGTSRLFIATFNPTTLALVTSANPVVTTAALNAVAIDGLEADFYWVAWARSDDANVSVVGISPATLAVSSTSAVVMVARANAPTRLAVRRTSASGGHVIGKGLTDYDGHWNQAMSRPFLNVAGAVVAQDFKVDNWGWTPTTQPFVLEGRVYGLQGASADAASPKNLILFDITAADPIQVTASASTSRGPVRPVAAPALGNCSYAQLATVACRHTVQLSSTKAVAAILVQYNSVDAAIEVVEFTTRDTRQWQSAEHNGLTCLTGGLLYADDGAGLFEINFVAPPSLRVVDSGGAGNPNGKLLYTSIVEWTDAEGNVHWSEPAPVQTITVANHSVNVSYLGYSSSIKDAVGGGRGIKTRIYRTQVGGGIFYLIATIESIMGASGTYLDNATDATIASAAQLYTQPGLPNAALVRQGATGCSGIASYNGMIVVIADDGRSLRSSADRVVGEGLWFNPVWQMPLDESDLVAIWVQDGTLFAATRSSVYAIVGDPPSDSGSVGGLGAPRRLAVDVGCVDARSVVTTSLGTFFQSARGIELMSRAGSVEWIGQPVLGAVAAFPICVSAVVDREQALVYFEMASSETLNQVGGTGRALVFDLSLKTWVSADRRFNSAGVADTPAQSSALIYVPLAGGTFGWRYAWLGTDGVVYVEDRTTCLDPGSRWVKQHALVSWIHAAGLQGEQSIDRILLLAQRATDHDLAITVYFDYDDAKVESKPFTAAQIAALGRQWLDMGLTRSTNTAFKVMVEDATPSSGSVGTGEGATWIGLAFPGIAHRGVVRTSAAQRGS